MIKVQWIDNNIQNGSILDLNIRGVNNSNLHQPMTMFIDKLQKEQQSIQKQIQQLEIGQAETLATAGQPFSKSVLYAKH